MTLPTIFDVCIPRKDVRDGSITEAELAADLAAVLRGTAPKEYMDPAEFFARTYPTDGLKTLLRSVCSRLSGSSGSIAPIFRLDTNYGGGKTHALIALSHAARGMQGVADAAEFLDPALIPPAITRVAAFDGENADPFNGRQVGGGIKVFTPWGDIAYALAGKEGYERVRNSDEAGAAPGAETIRELFGGGPALILLDELSVYLRKVQQRGSGLNSGQQLTAFLTSLFTAVESSPNAAVVFTLAIGKGGKATDAYKDENLAIADAMAEAEAVAARKATLLNPTEEDETAKVLQRRLFEQVDEARAAEVVDAFKQLWDHNKALLPASGATDNRAEAFLKGFPLHPELMDTLRNKTATLGNFQRVRGMLRLLGRTVGRMWAQRPGDTYAIQALNLDPGFEPVRQEFTTRLGQRQLLPAVRSDVAAVEGDQPALAQRLDAEAYIGLAPYGSMVARTIFLHTLAFNDALRGASKEQVRYAILGPNRDISFIDDAIARFMQHSAYLDDRPNVPLRFQAEANLTQIVRRQEEQVDPTEVRNVLNDRIKEIFGGGKVFNPVPFASGPYEVPDDAGDGKPYLVIINYDAADVAGSSVKIPDLVERIWRHHGSGGDLRANRNNLVFLMAEQGRVNEIRAKTRRHLALKDLLSPERLEELAEHQREKMREMAKTSVTQLALSIQQCYRHVLYPSKVRVEGAEVDLAHAAIEVHTASQTPGDGQKPIVQVLREGKKLRLPEDDPDSPSYVRDKTPLRKGTISTAALRAEFRRDQALPILVGDEAFLRGIRQGVDSGEYVYQSGDLIWAKGQPVVSVKIDESSYVHTATAAREQGIWPRPQREPGPTGGLLGATGDDQAAPPGGDQDAVQGTGGRAMPLQDGSAGQIAGLPPEQEVSAEGPLKEALASLWEKARARHMAAIGTVTLRLFEAGDGFRVMVLANGIARAEKTVRIEGGYETNAGGEFTMEFSGPVEDAQPIKDFLEPQLRAAADKSVFVTITVSFPDGLNLSGSDAEQITERLGKFGSGAAYVSATAKRAGE
ncbi:DUF499 domain-containing protein [Thalassobaculum sp.]|uniref:ATP-binding protein n=1 Tax=Thalassobaculum sp. TaxID=2022740 RepID=UPI0032ED55D3